MIYRPGFSVVSQLLVRASAVTGIPIAEIKFGTRDRLKSHIRFAITMAARKQGVSLANIGRAMGGFHHTSILHGERRAKQLANDPDFAELVQGIG